MATIDEIKQQAEAVKNATQVGENTALRVGGVLVDLCEWMKNLSGTSGGSASLGTLLTKLNSDNPFPTANGQVLTYNGSNFIWKTPTGSGGSSSSSSYPLTIYNGSSNTDYITYDGSSSAYLKFKNGFSISKVGLGYEISVSGGGSGSSSRIDTIKLFNSLGNEFDSVNLGSGNTIGFMQGDNVTLQAIVKDHINVIKISAEGGSSTGGSVDLSSYLTKTEASTTYAAKYHTHSASSITGFEGAVKLIKVNNALKADELNNSVYLWGNSFNGTNNINGNIKMGTAGGGSIQLWMNSGNMLDRTGNTLHIGYGLKESSDGEINLDANVTKVYTDNYSKHYDFKSNVFDVNSNQIHFGSEANGGTLSWDSANKCFKINGSVYATGGITALGVRNNVTTSNNVDFTFKSVTAKTFNVIDSIQLSDGLKLKRNVGDIDLVSIDGNVNSLYLDGEAESYYLSSDGGAYFSTLGCKTFNLPGADDFKIVDLNNTGFSIQFTYDGKTYKFTPYKGSVSVS